MLKDDQPILLPEKTRQAGKKSLELELLTETNASAYIDLVQVNTEFLKDSFRNSLKAIIDGDPRAYVKRHIEQQNKGLKYKWLIKNTGENIYLGVIEIHSIEMKKKRCGLGYFVDYRYFNQGIATDVVRKIVSLCIENWQVDIISLRVLPTNTASVRIANKLGFRKIQLLRRQLLTYLGIEKDILYFELQKEDFRRQ